MKLSIFNFALLNVLHRFISRYFDLKINVTGISHHVASTKLSRVMTKPT
jgi:hypothetical protein